MTLRDDQRGPSDERLRAAIRACMRLQEVPSIKPGLAELLADLEAFLMELAIRREKERPDE